MPSFSVLVDPATAHSAVKALFYAAPSCARINTVKTKIVQERLVKSSAESLLTPGPCHAAGARLAFGEHFEKATPRALVIQRPREGSVFGVFLACFWSVSGVFSSVFECFWTVSGQFLRKEKRRQGREGRERREGREGREDLKVGEREARRLKTLKFGRERGEGRR